MCPLEDQMDASTAAGRALVATDTLGRRIVARRFRSLQEKRQIVQASLQPGSSVAEMARRHGLNANLLFAWRRLHAQGLLGARTRRVGKSARTLMLPVQVSASPGLPTSPSSRAYIEVVLADGTVIRSVGLVERGALEQVLSLLRR
jgi:transposase